MCRGLPVLPEMCVGFQGFQRYVQKTTRDMFRELPDICVGDFQRYFSGFPGLPEICAESYQQYV